MPGMAEAIQIQDSLEDLDPLLEEKERLEDMIKKDLPGQRSLGRPPEKPVSPGVMTRFFGIDKKLIVPPPHDSIALTQRIPQKKGFLDRAAPRKIRIAMLGANGLFLNLSWMRWDDPGVVYNPGQKKAYDIGKSIPIKIIEDGKVTQGFFVDGDRGVGVNINASEGLMNLTTTADLAWAWLDTKKLIDAFTIDPTFWTKLKWFAAGGLLIGIMMFMRAG